VCGGKQEESIKHEESSGRSRGHGGAMRGYVRGCDTGAGVCGGRRCNARRPAAWRHARVRPPADDHARTTTRAWQVVAALQADQGYAEQRRRRARFTMRSVLSRRRWLRQRWQWQAPLQPSGYCLPPRMRSSWFVQSCSASSFSSVAASLNRPRRTRTCLSRSMVNSVSTALLPSFRR